MLTRTIPAILAFALLVFECALPWTARYFVTQDGPSHLYTAIVAHDVIFDRSSSYTATYQLNGLLTTNWTMSIVLDAIVRVAGPRHAEQALSTLCVLAGFFAFAYLLRSIDPEGSPWSPVVNFLVNIWFLWIGFYNFYLGMLLCACLTAFYIRRASSISWKTAVTIAALLLVLFFTHIHPFSLAILTLVIIAVWLQITAPSITRLIRTGVALLPGFTVLILYLAASPAGPHGSPDSFAALKAFPMHAFTSGRGPIAGESWLHPVVGLFILGGVLSMRKQEWKSVRGAFVLLAVISFGFYLAVPDQGFGGSLIKIRFVWAVYLFGAIVALTASRMRIVRLPLAIYVTALLAAALTQTMHRNVQAVSRAVTDASAVYDQIPQDAKVVRLRYWTPATRARFGFDQIALDPLFHLDAWFAAQHDWVDLSDYQALSFLFPVVVKPDIAPLRSALWGLEGGTESGAGPLRALLALEDFAYDYIIVIGDTNESDRTSILADLNHSHHLVATDAGNSYVWLFQKITPPAKPPPDPHRRPAAPAPSRQSSL